MGRAASKAWIAATQQVPSTEHLHRMTTLPAPISTGFVTVSPQARFPGAGGMPILDEDGVIVGGIAASGSTVSPFLPLALRPRSSAPRANRRIPKTCSSHTRWTRLMSVSMAMIGLGGRSASAIWWSPRPRASA